MDIKFLFLGIGIIIGYCANYKGCSCSVHGNAEKLAQQYDVLTHVMADNYPEILMCVIST